MKSRKASSCADKVKDIVIDIITESPLTTELKKLGLTDSEVKSFYHSDLYLEEFMISIGKTPKELPQIIM